MVTNNATNFAKAFSLFHTATEESCLMAVQVATLTKTTIWVRICQWVASTLKEMSLKLLIISMASHIYQVTRTLSFLHTNNVLTIH